MLPVVKFALNNTVHASTVYTPLYVNGLTHPCVPLALPLDDLQLDEGEVADWLVDVNPVSVKQQVSEFLATRSIVLQHVRDAMADSQDKHNEQADDKGRSCIESIMVDDQALMNTEILPANVVSAVYNTKLWSRFIGPFTAVAKKVLAYTLKQPGKLRTCLVFYVGI